jgi:hypothetical protein
MSARSSSPPPTSLPPSSPPDAFSDMTDGEDNEEEVVDDERDAQRLGQAYEEDEDDEGEDLFGLGMEGCVVIESMREADRDTDIQRYTFSPHQQ